MNTYLIVLGNVLLILVSATAGYQIARGVDRFRRRGYVIDEYGCECDDQVEDAVDELYHDIELYENRP